jgi:biopolymer transport protein ExbB/TolQ
MILKKPQGWSAAAFSLLGPIAIGIAMYLVLELLISRHAITDETLLRYLIGHPISRLTVAMFCVGLASLLLIANNVFDQYCGIDSVANAIVPIEEHLCVSREGHAGKQLDGEETDPAANYAALLAAKLLRQLDQLKLRFKQYYLWDRMANALEYVQRSGSAIGVDHELKYLADMDLNRQQRRYSLVRIVIWATPMLGFLGTVLGISQALGSIQVGPENDFGQMMNGMRSSLYVAFDTTALALTLSITLMFIQFLTDRFETQLLEIVDKRAQCEIANVFGEDAFKDSKTEVVAGLGRSMIAATEELVRRQVAIWQNSIQSAEQYWKNSVFDAGETVRAKLSESLDQAIDDLAHQLGESIQKADTSMARRWQQWQVVLSENARQAAQHQTELARQTELITDLINKLESVGDCQNALAENLDALHATANLQETLDRLNTTLAKISPDGVRHQPNSANHMTRRDNARPGQQIGLSSNANAA